MPVVVLDTWLVIILDIVLWFVIHIGISIFTQSLPVHLFARDVFPFRSYGFERQGRFYETVFLIKAWKKYLPDGARLFKEGFRKKGLERLEPDYLKRFIIESRRAEVAHGLQILPVGVFFLFNPVWVGWFMVFYALIANMPCMMTQRYNRPRFERVIRMLEQRNQ